MADQRNQVTAVGLHGQLFKWIKHLDGVTAIGAQLVSDAVRAVDSFSRVGAGLADGGHAHAGGDTHSAPVGLKQVALELVAQRFQLCHRRCGLLAL